jgi:hypothetical protein
MHGKKIVTYYEIGTRIYLSFSAFDMKFHCKLILLSISAPLVCQSVTPTPAQGQ